jgi:hypothetical protein
MNIEARLRWASILIGVGLLVQLLSLLPVHPLAFMSFLMIGSPLMLAGIVMYLTSLLPGKKP